MQTVLTVTKSKPVICYLLMFVILFVVFFSKAHQLSSLLDQQEQALRQTPAGYDSPGADAVIRDYDAVGGQYSFLSAILTVEIMLFITYFKTVESTGPVARISVEMPCSVTVKIKLLFGS
jgi:Fe2+ transport system protein B